MNDYVYVKIRIQNNGGNTSESFLYPVCVFMSNLNYYDNGYVVTHYLNFFFFKICVGFVSWRGYFFLLPSLTFFVPFFGLVIPFHA